MFLVFAVLVLPVLAHAACPSIHRSSTVLRHFRAQFPCPATGKTMGPCPGYVIDHQIPLCFTGPEGDILSNLQWQDAEAARKKDRLEKALCRKSPRPCVHERE